MQTSSVGRPCLTGYEIVEEIKRYCRGNLVYKRGRGDGRWFEWIKQDEGKGKDDKKETTTAQQRCERGAEEEREYCQQRRESCVSYGGSALRHVGVSCAACATSFPRLVRLAQRGRSLYSGHVHFIQGSLVVWTLARWSSRWRRWVLRLFLRRYWGRMGSVLNALKRQQGDGGRTEALEQQGDGKALVRLAQRGRSLYSGHVHFIQGAYG